jgi:hypothetical protein
MLVYVGIHDPFNPRTLLNSRKNNGLFPVVMKMQEIVPTDAVPNKVGVVIRFDVRGLQVDTVQPANDDVVDNNHLIGHFRVTILLFFILEGIGLA